MNTKRTIEFIDKCIAAGVPACIFKSTDQILQEETAFRLQAIATRAAREVRENDQHR